ncbi:Hypothetical_protein [Hexamita inflata]|uniref:Hypothetical_protein n=1 Tax=Hexamita inflata TaxID=28002 RepID=A0AA86PDF1_9EUKA|nr:Hypothetical protein HINF_LOCUS21412 [Hexamita inflata]
MPLKYVSAAYNAVIQNIFLVKSVTVAFEEYLALLPLHFKYNRYNYESASVLICTKMSFKQYSIIHEHSFFNPHLNVCVQSCRIRSDSGGALSPGREYDQNEFYSLYKRAQRLSNFSIVCLN